MDDLVQWLRAQLDEDERTARAAGGAAWEELPVSGWVHTSPLPSSEWQPPGYDHHVASAPLAEDRAHIVAHDPARVLREIDAKRLIMECHEPWTEVRGDTICGRCGREHIDGRPGGHFPCQTMRLLALPYADRPGYRDEWRP
ncbi:DUF6221 family protein [Streptomyces sp. DHE17-7]|uniref:DUF6221 family protein n=1 Tax=Streptomyces sp. DHE17-7 TaxID=2759949 RepID=UPI000ED92DA5|nr:DUF6221 family protein [Streptomyces sp. DHE17-7]MBJ6623516.1 hypothetical protein [Streptomyces sp. DHE17-7]RIH58298.1 hypothetical protein D3C59_35995 [Streptomyces sp. SHP22-7]